MINRIMQFVPLVVAMAGAITGNVIDLPPEQVASVAMLIMTLWTLIDRRAVFLADPDFDPREFWATSTNIVALFQAIASGVFLVTGGLPGLPDVAIPAAQLLAFIVGEIRLAAAHARRGDTAAVAAIRSSPWMSLGGKGLR